MPTNEQAAVAEHHQFLTAWAETDPDERRRVASDWVLEHASHPWLNQLATASAQLHGAGLSGLVDKLTAENPFVSNGVTKIAVLFARDITNQKQE